MKNAAMSSNVFELTCRLQRGSSTEALSTSVRSARILARRRPRTTQGQSGPRCDSESKGSTQVGTTPTGAGGHSRGTSRKGPNLRLLGSVTYVTHIRHCSEVVLEGVETCLRYALPQDSQHSTLQGDHKDRGLSFQTAHMCTPDF